MSDLDALLSRPVRRAARPLQTSPEVSATAVPPNATAAAPCEPLADEETSSAPVEWWRFVLIGLLVCLSGLFSGLTLGLLSLDIVGLEIVIASGTETEARYARKIKPLRAQGNLLLCTLLLGNTSVNAMLAILFADLTSGLVGLLVSTVIIVIIGEITPQAVCSRHALAIGANTTPIVWFFLIILYPLAWPVSRVLDLTLGAEVGQIYSKNMLKKMIEIHADHPEISSLQRGDAQVVVGALDFAAKPVSSIMTPIEDVFTLDMDQRLDRDTLEDILQHGHSRIPVCDGSSQSITDILIVKDLALLNPDDGVPVRMIIDDYGRKISRVFHDATLGDLLAFFKSKRIHLAVVMRVASDGPGDPVYENIGIVTLEDLFEEIIQDEIVDETDLYVDVGATGDKVRNDNRAVDYTSARNSLRRKRMATSITPQQASAVCSYLGSEVAEFGDGSVSVAVLRRLIEQQRLGRFKAPPPPERVAIYTRGVPTQNFTLVLEGRLRIESGPDKFTSEAGPWSILGRGALTEGEYVPDFTATVEEDVTLLVISAREYAAARRATSVAAAGTDVLTNLKGPTAAAGGGSPACVGFFFFFFFFFLCLYIYNYIFFFLT
jgi:metal transporter CNNM